jgi:HAD superfamily hydrolase (TIGR01490 family)
MDETYRQQEKRNVVAAFDFDGTLTTKNTLIAFIRFTHGRCRLFLGFLRHTHWLLMMKMGLYPNWKVKEKVFSHFYKGMTHEQFILWGRSFADVAETVLPPQMVETLRRHQNEGHMVCVVTASIDEWVRPVCERLNISRLIATRIELSADGRLTGRFLTPNCYGAQKASRFLEVYPMRQTYLLYVYGDSRGDKELLALADKGFRIKRIRKNAN